MEKEKEEASRAHFVLLFWRVEGFGVFLHVSLDALFGAGDVDSEFHAGGGEEGGGVSSFRSTLLEGKGRVLYLRLVMKEVRIRQYRYEYLTW
jgi:hypothetical protein